MTEVPAIEIKNLKTRLENAEVHRDVSFTIERGVVAALIGASGAGKSTILREIIGLLRPSAGTVKLLGTDVWTTTEEELADLRRQFGVLFQNSALFSSLTCAENVAVPMIEQAHLPKTLIPDLVDLRLKLVGLDPKTGLKMPSELSGGMRKRVGLARALALEPAVLFLDEPTSGLDPINARGFDELIRTLCDGLGLTVLLVTHDIDTVISIVDHLVVLENGVVLSEGPVDEVRRLDHPWIQSYFSTR